MNLPNIIERKEEINDDTLREKKNHNQIVMTVYLIFYIKNLNYYPFSDSKFLNVYVTVCSCFCQYIEYAFPFSSSASHIRRTLLVSSRFSVLFYRTFHWIVVMLRTLIMMMIAMRLVVDSTNLSFQGRR